MGSKEIRPLLFAYVSSVCAGGVCVGVCEEGVCQRVVERGGV